MAIARSSDVWGHVQQQLLDLPPSVRLVPFQGPTIQVGEGDPGWFLDRYRAKADEIFVAWERALVRGRKRKAARLHAAWMHALHADRLAYAREIARERGLRLDPMGHGPVVDVPLTHYRDRLPWNLTPIGHYDPEALPYRAASVVETWNGSGWVFDRLYVADEPVCTGNFPAHSLIGAISPDARTSDWFVLDRWAS